MLLVGCKKGLIQRSKLEADYKYDLELECRMPLNTKGI